MLLRDVRNIHDVIKELENSKASLIRWSGYVETAIWKIKELERMKSDMKLKLAYSGKLTAHNKRKRKWQLKLIKGGL